MGGWSSTRSIGMDQTRSRRPEGGGDGSGCARLRLPANVWQSNLTAWPEIGYYDTYHYLVESLGMVTRSFLTWPDSRHLNAIARGAYRVWLGEATLVMNE